MKVDYTPDQYLSCPLPVDVHQEEIIRLVSNKMISSSERLIWIRDASGKVTRHLHVESLGLKRSLNFFSKGTSLDGKKITFKKVTSIKTPIQLKAHLYVTISWTKLKSNESQFMLGLMKTFEDLGSVAFNSIDSREEKTLVKLTVLPCFSFFLPSNLGSKPNYEGVNLEIYYEEEQIQLPIKLNIQKLWGKHCTCLLKNEFSHYSREIESAKGSSKEEDLEGHHNYEERYQGSFSGEEDSISARDRPASSVQISPILDLFNMMESVQEEEKITKNKKIKAERTHVPLQSSLKEGITTTETNNDPQQDKEEFWNQFKNPSTATSLTNPRKEHPTLLTEHQIPLLQALSVDTEYEIRETPQQRIEKSMQGKHQGNTYTPGQHLLAAISPAPADLPELLDFAGFKLVSSKKNHPQQLLPSLEPSGLPERRSRIAPESARNRFYWSEVQRPFETNYREEGRAAQFGNLTKPQPRNRGNFPGDQNIQYNKNYSNNTRPLLDEESQQATWDFQKGHKKPYS